MFATVDLIDVLVVLGIIALLLAIIYLVRRA